MDSMKLDRPLGLRAVTDRRPMHLEAVSTQVLQRVAESLGLWRDAQVTSGPRTAAQPVERGGQRARVGPGISLDDALDTQEVETGDPALPSPPKRGV